MGEKYFVNRICANSPYHASKPLVLLCTENNQMKFTGSNRPNASIPEDLPRLPILLGLLFFHHVNFHSLLEYV